MCLMKGTLFCPEGIIRKGAIGKWRVFSDATSWCALRQSKVWEWGDQFNCSVESEVLPILPEYKDIRDLARLPTAFNRGFEPRTSNRVYPPTMVCSNTNHSANEKTFDSGVQRCTLVTEASVKDTRQKHYGSRTRIHDLEIDGRTRWPLIVSYFATLG